MQLTILIFKTKQHFTFKEIKYFRGFIGNYKKDSILFHNHYSEKIYNQRTPIIQYKIINGHFAVLGINEGAKLIKAELLDLTSIKIGSTEYEVSMEIKNYDFELKVDKDNFYEYFFLTPWMALNSENYKKYKREDFDLNKAITNNILEFLKSASFFTKEKIISLCLVDEIVVEEKKTKFICFKGKFKTNVKLPDYISLGKRKSVGYGMIKNRHFQ